MLLDPLVDAFINHPWQTLRLGSIIFFYILLIVIIVSLMFRRYIQDHWYELADTPFGLLTSGFFQPVPGMGVFESTQHHFLSLLWRLGKEVMDIAVMPFHTIVQGLATILETLRAQLDGIRQQLGVMRHFLGSMAQDIMVRIETSAAGVMFDALKMREQMKRSYGLFKMIIYIVEHTKLFMESIVNGPVGAFGSIADKLGLAAAVFTFGAPGIATWKNALCFSEDTLISLACGRSKKISQIVPGESLLGLSGSNTVTSIITCRILSKDQMFYSGLVGSDSLLVAADHVLLHCPYKNCPAKVPARVKHHVKYGCPWFVPVNKLHVPNTVYCLTTSGHYIAMTTSGENMSTLVFSDYTDSLLFTTQVKAHEYARQEYALCKTLSLLNNSDARFFSTLPSTCFICVKSDYISSVNSHVKKYIESMPINADLIVGTCEVKANTLDMYALRSDPNFQFSARCILWDKYTESWRLVCDMARDSFDDDDNGIRIVFDYIGKNEDTTYQFISKSGSLTFKDIALRDMTEVSKEEDVEEILEILCPV
jgi:hypothetical protein